MAAASGRSLLSVPRIIRSNLQVVLNTVNYAHESWVGDAPGLVLRTKQRVEQFNSILKRDHSIAVQAVVERLLAELESDERLAKGMWLTEAINHLDANQSCFESLGQFLSDAIVVVFKELLPVVDLNDNLRLAADPDLEELRADLFKNPFVSGSPGGRLCTQAVGQPPASRMPRVGAPVLREASGRNTDSIQGVSELFYPPNYAVRFPFGSTVCSRVWNYRAQGSHLHEFLVEGCSTLVTLDVYPQEKPPMSLLALDLFAGAFPSCKEPVRKILLLFCRVEGALEDCVRLFRFVWRHDRLLACVQRLAESLSDDELELAMSHVDSVLHMEDVENSERKTLDDGAGEGIPGAGLLLLLQLSQAAMRTLIEQVSGENEIAIGTLRDLFGMFRNLHESMEDTATPVTSESCEGNVASGLQQSLQDTRLDLDRCSNFLEYALLLRSYFVSTVGRRLVTEHLRGMLGAEEAGEICSPVLYVPDVQCFLMFVVTTAEDPFSREAASQCVGPILLKIIGDPRERCIDASFDCLACVRNVFFLVVGQHELFRGSATLHLAWLPKADLQPQSFEVTYTMASAIVGWSLQLFEHCLAENTELAQHLALAFSEAAAAGGLGGDDGFLALLFSQTWSDHLELPLVDAKLRLLTAPVQTAATDSTCDLRRVLVVSTLKFTLQLAADRLLALSMVDGETPDELDESAHLLSDLLAEFASSVRVSQSVGDAGALLAAQNQAQLQTPLAVALGMLPATTHVHLVHLFLRQITKCGTERDSAVRALAVDRGREDGRRILPRGFFELPDVKRMCAPRDAGAVRASPLSLHEGYDSAVQALREALRGEVNEALRVLQGQSDLHPFPEADAPRRLLLAMAAMHMAQTSCNLRNDLMHFVDSVPWMDRDCPITELMRTVVDGHHNTPQVLRDWFDDPRHAGLSCLVLHARRPHHHRRQ